MPHLTADSIIINAANSMPVLVADIGGTNARFACLDLANGQWFGQWAGAVRDYEDIYAAFETARDHLSPTGNIQAACIAIAAPIHGDLVDVSNSHWAFSRAELQRRFGWPRLSVINDFHAAAYGVATLSPHQYLPIGHYLPGNSHLSSAVIGPGTGLGIAGLFSDECLPAACLSAASLPAASQSWSAVATEGGHARFAPFDEEEIAILQVLHRQLGCVQREDILSGRGLCNLYRAIAQVHGLDVPAMCDPVSITAQAVENKQCYAARVLERFCGILGTVAADVALDLGTRGTLFFAGGILPRVADFLLASCFRERFDNHLRFSGHLKVINTVLVTEQNLGLIGAAHCLRRQHLGTAS